ncbi:MAG: carboxypeptidase-like regulatory domain-containing protein [Bacteroidota bacterium]
MKKRGTSRLMIVSLFCFFSWSSYLFGQNITITGKVYDESSQESLIGASIIQSGTSFGTVTDVEGNYSITVPSDAVLIFSYTGYETQEVQEGGGT